MNLSINQKIILLLVVALIGFTAYTMVFKSESTRTSNITVKPEIQVLEQGKEDKKKPERTDLTKEIISNNGQEF